MIHKYEDGQSLCAIAHKLYFAVSTVNTFVKDAAPMKEHEIFILNLIYVCLSVCTVFSVFFLSTELYY
jgi:fluoride ion exporter CrcB/FEX